MDPYHKAKGTRYHPHVKTTGLLDEMVIANSIGTAMVLKSNSLGSVSIGKPG